MKKTATLILSLSFAILLKSQTTVNLTPVHDHYIETFGGGMGKNAFFKFDISSIPSNAVITDVRFNGYSFYQQPAWDGDMRYIRFNNQTWTETDSIQYTWNTMNFVDTILQPMGFGMAVGFSQSPDLTSLFVQDFSIGNGYFSMMMKDPDDGTCCPMSTGAPYNNPDSVLFGNIFNNKMGIRPRNYANPNQRPYLTVTYGIPPSIGFGAGTGPYCEAVTIIIDGSPTTGDAPLSFQWQLNGVDIPGATGNTYTIPNFSPADSGDYTLIATNPFGTDTSNIVSLDFNPNPVPDLGPDTSLCGNEIVTLDAGPGGTSYQWSHGSTFTQTLDVDQLLLGLGSTDVSVIVTDAIGCVGYDTVNVFVIMMCAGIEDIEQSDVHVTPNPHNGIFNVNIDHLAEETTLEVVNINGQVVHSRTLSENPDAQTLSVDLTGHPSGMYLVRLRNKGSMVNIKTVSY